MPVDWKSISNEDELRNLLREQREDQFLLVFKHSPSCMISTMAKGRLERKPIDHFTYYIIDVISQRNLSNFLSEYTHVRHESPQCLLFMGSELITSQSHAAIDSSDLLEKSLEHSESN